MTKFLPPKLRELFAPRPPIEFLEPIAVRKMPAYTGLGAFLNRFEDVSSAEPPTEEPIEILKPVEIRSRKRKRRMEEHDEQIAEKAKLWCPNENPQATDEAYNTLFVARLNYATTAETLKREFEVIAPVKAIRLVRDLDGKSRGYAFVEMEDDSSTRLVYSKMRGRTIDGADIFIDVERGRTVKEWKPRRLGNSTNTPRTERPKKAVLKQMEAAAAAERARDRRGGPGGYRDGAPRGGGQFHGGGRGRGRGRDRRDFDRPREYDDHRDGGGGRYDRRDDRDSSYGSRGPPDRHDRREDYDRRR